MWITYTLKLKIMWITYTLELKTNVDYIATRWS